MAAIDDKPFDVAGAVERLKDLVDSVYLGPSTGCIVDAATERGIPSIRLNDGNLVQIGYGKKQRRIWTAETDRTSAIAESISRDKDLTKSLLKSCGVPVPEGRLVSSEDDAADAANDIGYPVVVKPRDGNHGRGVCVDLRSEEDVRSAYHLAYRESSDVIVESFIRGVEHRLLVVGGKMVAAAGGERACVTGDGTHTIAELIDLQINSDPRRGENEEFPLNTILLDRDSTARLEVERQGYSAETILPEGLEILVQANGNVAFDVTDHVHPSVAAAVSLAARVVGLDIAGVDMVIEDISKPLHQQQGAVVEVNAGPGLLMHLKPATGSPRPVGQAIIDHLFPSDESGRIPVIGIAGSHGKTEVARLLARMLQLSGKTVGTACSSGLFVDHRRVEKKDSANWDAGHRLLMNRAIDAAIIENGDRVILGEGLAYDRCQIGVVTNFDPAFLPTAFDIHSQEKMYSVLRTQVDVVLEEGAAVLNAEDPLVASLAELSDGEVVFFSTNPDTPAANEHKQQGGRTVVIRGGEIKLTRGEVEISVVALAATRLEHTEADDHQVQNVLAAVAAAWALDIPPRVMRAVLETFDPAHPDNLALAPRPEKRKTKSN